MLGCFRNMSAVLQFKAVALGACRITVMLDADTGAHIRMDRQSTCSADLTDLTDFMTGW